MHTPDMKTWVFKFKQDGKVVTKQFMASSKSEAKRMVGAFNITSGPELLKPKTKKVK